MSTTTTLLCIMTSSPGLGRVPYVDMDFRLWDFNMDVRIFTEFHIASWNFSHFIVLQPRTEMYLGILRSGCRYFRGFIFGCTEKFLSLHTPA